MKWKKFAVVTLATTAILAGCGNDSQETTPVEETQQESQVESNVEDNATDGDSAATESKTDIQEDLENPTSSDAPGLEAQTFEIDLMAAVDIFDETFPGASIDSVDFEIKNGEPQYSIDGFDGQNEYELDIHADSGEILKQETDSDTDTDDDAIDFSLVISPQEAMEIALEDAGNAKVKDWDLSVDDGRTLYEIDLEDEDPNLFDDVDVDAVTGEIVGQS
ncbi:MAG: PepSY domain-containing protein [Atopococcus tabaci]|uniref:PepSY domain-containing protein n=1 Tax=Atopococcus tabaci TaxID=269774 RepID=A0AA43ZRG1_9LACT|nr:PepSY domain-containing protein [Atopococcus tabaci]